MPRIKGATSCVGVRLSELTNVLQPNSLVYIWRRQANDLRVKIEDQSPANNNTLNASGAPPEMETITETITVEDIN